MKDSSPERAVDELEYRYQDATQKWKALVFNFSGACVYRGFHESQESQESQEYQEKIDNNLRIYEYIIL